MTPTTYPIAPWCDEKDERHEGVALIDCDDDFECKRTVRKTAPGMWWVTDWEVADYDGQRVWWEAGGFSVSQSVIDVIANLTSNDSGASK